MLALSILYNLIFLGAFVDFILLLYGYDKKEYDIDLDGLVYMMQSMFFGYNIILHFPIVIVNSVVIIKEFSLEFF